MHKRRFLITMPDGSLIWLKSVLDDSNPKLLDTVNKMLFELSRPILGVPGSIHYEDYLSQIPLVSREVQFVDIPIDYTFRNAWEDTGTVVQVNMSKARIIHMDRIRVARDAKLLKSDVDFVRALESGDIGEQNRLKVSRQTLRDIPQTFDLNVFITPEALKAAWPMELN